MHPLCHRRRRLGTLRLRPVPRHQHPWRHPLRYRYDRRPRIHRNIVWTCCPRRVHAAEPRCAPTKSNGPGRKRPPARIAARPSTWLGTRGNRLHRLHGISKPIARRSPRGRAPRFLPRLPTCLALNMTHPEKIIFGVCRVIGVSARAVSLAVGAEADAVRALARLQSIVPTCDTLGRDYVLRIL